VYQPPTVVIQQVAAPTEDLNGDGVIDDKDIDSDGDGIPDDEDSEPNTPQIQPIVVVIDEAALANAMHSGDSDGLGSGYIYPGGDGGANGSNDSNGDGIPDDAQTLNVIHDMQRNLMKTMKKGVNARPYYQPPLAYGLY